MAKKWLNLFFRYSAITFYLKQKLSSTDKWYKMFFYAVLVILLELLFVIITLPIYFILTPKKLQERGWVFPHHGDERGSMRAYIIKRKISLGTVSGAGGVLFFKFFLLVVVSNFLLGGQILLAATQDWDFSTASEYAVSSSSIEFVGGTARLKDLGSAIFGNTTNSGFTSDATGWTYADWGQGGGEVNINGSHVLSGGNPGGYIQISAPAGSSDELGGYYRQSFVTTVANPTTTLSFDWLITAVGATAPITFKVYAFVDTGSGVPVIGQEVWSSGEITGTSAWASVSNLDVSSKVTAAGTYFLKMAIWLETGGTSTGPFTVGYDNVLLNWSKTSVAYDPAKPTVTPSSSLSMTKTVSWNSFTETATKNGGEIYYQLSDDNGSTWKYWTGATWSVAGGSNYNIASDVNTYITNFATSSNQIKFKAFLSSNGTQQVILDNVAIGYTENLRPTVTNLTPVQNTQNGYVFVNYNLQDTESDISSLANYEYSLTGAFAGEQVAMMASTTDPSHNGISNLTTSASGTAHTFVWDAKSQLGAVYNTTVYVRLRANDGIGSGAYTTSTAVTVDYVNPVVTNVSAVQPLNTTTVQISYDLSDNTADSLFADFQVSGDGGSTWVVPVTAASGAVGSGVTTGNGKIIYWNAGIDYVGHQQSDIQVRVRAKDKWQNLDGYVTSTNFALDTLAPATLVTTDLIAQPNAGDTTALVGGSFTEANPSTNTFYAAVSGGAYDSATFGTSDTASPSNQATTVSTTLKGNDYISKVKITHTDDYGQSTDNENISPSVSFKYVKPYTPGAPILSNPITNRLDLTINPHVNEIAGLEYAVYETTTAKYVQADGTLGVSPVWRTDSAWGTITVTGLNSPVALYVFQEKSRNTSDAAHAASSESAYSATSNIINSAPVIALDSVAQVTDGNKYVNINYTGTDGQGDINNIGTYEYSRDNSSWSTMTEKSGAGSDGVSNLVFLPTGSAHKFVWDSGTDLTGIEDSTVYVHLRSSDTIANSNLAASGAFEIDNVLPVVSSVAAVQNAGARTVTISYNLTDANNSTVELLVSEDGGGTWSVPHSAVSGDIGTGITPGTGKTIVWNAGTDFDNQYQTDVQVRIRALDTFGNQGSYAASANFTVDTHAPVISNVTAVQDAAADTFTFHYDISEDAGNSAVVLEISNNSGSTWVVPTTSASGAIGSVVSGTGKTITWNGTTDYNDHEKTEMRIRITAADQYSNNSNNSSVDFSLDTWAPRVTSVSAAQVSGSTNVQISYDLADQNLSTVELDLSSDSGSTWTVTDTSVAGSVGANVSAGTGKTVTWNAGVDFDEQDLSTMKVRVRARDVYLNQSSNVTSSNFALDTLNPTANVVANLKAQPLAGDATALVGGSFSETNPNTNVFYAAVDSADYTSSTAGDSNTATPSDQITNTGDVLDGNDYISKVKIIHTDDYGQSVTNENTSPNIAYKYVKPYTPVAPTVDNPTVGTVDVLINPHASEATNLEYAIYETSQGKYVVANGTLGASPIWQTRGTGSGQWGQTSGIIGKITVSGLVNDSYTYQFQVKSRNISDAGHTMSSESALSSGASSVNQSPYMTLNSIGQTIDGTKYVTTNYTGYDLESETSTLIVAEYSVNNTNWYDMTEKTGVGSEGTTNLTFSNGGVLHNFMWNADTDLPNTEDSTVYLRLRANDGTSSGAIETSGAFVVDTKKPVISSVTASQVAGTNNVNFTYTLTDLSNSTVEVDVSEDGGGSWSVVDTSVGGDVGTDISPGMGKTITWNAGVDFNEQEQSDMRVRIRALDSYGNQGLNVSSVNFSLDTKNPIVSNVTSTQNVGARTVNISYDLSDANNSNVEIDISEDGGLTWLVTDTSVTGDVGTGVVPGTGNTITWNAGDDFDGQDQLDMRARVRAADTFANASGDVLSSNFSI